MKQSTTVYLAGIVTLVAFIFPQSHASGFKKVDQTIYGTVDVTRTLKEKPKSWDEVIEPQIQRKIEQEKQREEARLAEEKRLAEEAAAAAVYTPVYTEPVVQTGYAGNGYSYGQCTYYVASRRNVPGGWGNAANWYNSAQASGFPVGTAPRPGAIGVEKGINHVVYVEAVIGDMVTVSEMNYMGWNVVSQRTAPASAFLYIY